MKSPHGIDYGAFASGKHRPGRAPHSRADRWPTVYDKDGVGWVYKLWEGFSRNDFIAWAQEDEVFGDDIEHIVHLQEVIFP
jgi:hypothetical protein